MGPDPVVDVVQCCECLQYFSAISTMRRHRAAKHRRHPSRACAGCGQLVQCGITAKRHLGSAFHIERAAVKEWFSARRREPVKRARGEGAARRVAAGAGPSKRPRVSDPRLPPPPDRAQLDAGLDNDITGEQPEVLEPMAVFKSASIGFCALTADHFPALVAPGTEPSFSEGGFELTASTQMLWQSLRNACT